MTEEPVAGEETESTNKEKTHLMGKIMDTTGF